MEAINQNIMEVQSCSHSYQRPNNTSVGRGCPLPYSVMRPAQERRRFNRDKFNYKEYLRESTEELQRTKQVPTVIDVDLDE